MSKILVPCLLGFVAASLAAQTPTSKPAAADSPSSALAEMKKLDFLVGQWKGEGWILLGPQRRTFVEAESVQSKQGGLLLVIEGRGRSMAPDRSQEITVHDALGLAFYDIASKRHLFHAYKGGNYIESDLKVADKGLQWGFRDPRSNGLIRFTMSLNEQGRWFEIGEFSQDGKAWQKFFEMTLQRTP